MREVKSFNIFALEGDKTVDDMELCTSLGLDPKLAYTPQINDAAITKMYNENLQGYLERGLNESEAKALASEAADKVKQRVKNAMKE